MFALTLVLSAHAGEEACTACCRAGGAPGCPTSLVVYGDGSRLFREAGAWRVAGLWRIACGGPGVFDPSAALLLENPPLGGELVHDGATPLQAHCFQQACGLPPGACFSPPDDAGRFFVLECGTGLPIDAATLARAPAPRRYGAAKVVVVDGRPLVVAPAEGATTGASAPAPSAPAATTSWSAPAPSAPAATTSGSAPVPSAPTATTSWSAPAPSAPAVTTSGSAPAPSAPTAMPAAAAPAAASADTYATFATSLPKDPPASCNAPIEPVRAEARRRVDMGDEKRIRKDTTGALQEYRAALAMDVCNPYAWLGIGEIASEAARPDLAVRSLRNTTRLLPGHHGAWTLLGGAYEALRQGQLAAEAYGEALALRPNHPDALAGWRRTAAPPVP